MTLIRRSTIVVLLFYIISAIAIWYSKPSLFFKENGDLKEFGLENEKTIFYYPIVMVFMAIIIFYISEIFQ